VGFTGRKSAFLYLTAGIFHDNHSPVGIVHCYGVSVFAPTLEEACGQSRRSLAALKGVMSGVYRQIHLQLLTVWLVEWTSPSTHDMNQVLQLLESLDLSEFRVTS
jgi:hypothetical protein